MWHSKTMQALVALPDASDSSSGSSSSGSPAQGPGLHVVGTPNGAYDGYYWLESGDPTAPAYDTGAAVFKHATLEYRIRYGAASSSDYGWNIVSMTSETSWYDLARIASTRDSAVDAFTGGLEYAGIVTTYVP